MGGLTTDPGEQGMSGMAVVLGVIQEQMSELNRKIDSLVSSAAAGDNRLRAVEVDVATLKAERDRKPSQWPAIASAVVAIGSLALAVAAVMFAH